MQPLSARTLFLGAILVVPAALAQSQVVYDDTQHITLDGSGTPLFYRFSKQYGDDINLAPGYRDISRFTFQYYGDFTASASPSPTLTIRFYANDGILAQANVTTSQMPHTLLWESDKVPLAVGYSTVALDVPQVTVPDRFTWTVEFAGLTGAVGNSAGLILADPPTIGLPLANGRFGSYWDAWIKGNPSKDDSWSLVNFGVGPNDPKANFFAKVEAVPEPSTWALMAAGTAMLVFGARRARR